MHTGVAKVELFFAVAEIFAQPRVVEHQPAFLINHQQRRWAKLQQLAELALVLGRLGSWRRAAVGRSRSAYSGIRRHTAPAGLTWRTLTLKSAEFELPIRPAWRADVTFGQ